MENCFEYFKCQRIDCPAHSVDNKKPCWDIEETKCQYLPEIMRSNNVIPKDIFCSKCIYYKHVNP